MQGYNAANLDSMQFATAYQAAMQNLVLTKLALCKTEGAVLDFGSGTGDYAHGLQKKSGKSILSFEPDTKLHTAYPPGCKVIATLDDIPPQSLAAVYSLNVFEHIKEDKAALAQLVAKCKPGALIFVLVPANMKLWTPMDVYVGHHRRYSPIMLSAMAQDLMLDVIDQGWFDKTGYFATKAYQLIHKIKPEHAKGPVSSAQVKAFDIVFNMLEPVFNQIKCGFGKNCWILLKKP